MRNGMSKAFLTGLSAALCAGSLDLALSLWLDFPAGLRSAANLLLTLAASTTIALAAWLVADAVLRLLLRSGPRPLALPISASLLTVILLRGVLLSVALPEAPLGRAVFPLTLLVVAVGFLASKLSHRGKGGGSPLPGEGCAMGEGPGVRSLATGALLALAAPLLLLLDRAPAPPPSSAHPPAVPHVILLSIDTLRADALACSGAPESRAPHLDALAGDSLCFARASSSAAWTLPAMASVMTGVSPQVHGAVHLKSRVPDGLPTLAEVLRHAGYRTAAFVSSTVLGPQANLTQGFDEFHAYPGPWLGRSLGATLLTAWVPRFRPDETPPPELAETVMDWLRTHRDEPFFLWIHTFDPHAPYGPPRRYLQGKTPPTGERFQSLRFEGWDEEAIRSGTWVPTAAERAWIRQLYLAEIRWVDDTVGRLVSELKRLGLYDGALILVVSDHGEEFWEHGTYGHGHTLYDELLHVPLLAKLPEIGRIGRIGPISPIGRIITPVSTASLYATVLDACRLPLPAGYPAAPSLLALPPNGPGSPLFFQGLNRYEDRRAVRFDRFKYIRWTMSGKEELYDLEADPGEKIDLAKASPAGLREGRRLLADFEAEGRRARQLLRLPDDEAAEIDEHTLERLRSLGYAR
jgi:arylsulfatase A-like enzyme